MKDLSNVTVLFVFEEKFIGEMQFRFSDYPANYSGNAFLHKIEHSGAKIEILSSINEQAVKLCDQKQLTYVAPPPGSKESTEINTAIDS